MPSTDLRAARANRNFGTDEKHIRTEIAVMNKNTDALGLPLSKIADCVRMDSYPYAIGDPREQFFVRAKPERSDNEVAN